MKKYIYFAIATLLLACCSSCNALNKIPGVYEKLYCADPFYSEYVISFDGLDYCGKRDGKIPLVEMDNEIYVNVFESEDAYKEGKKLKSERINLSYEKQQGVFLDSITGVLCGTTSDNSLWLRMFNGFSTSFNNYYSIVSIRGIDTENPSRYSIFYTTPDEKVEYSVDNNIYIEASFINYDGEFLHKQFINQGIDIKYSGPRPYREPTVNTSYLFNGWELLSDGLTYQATYKELLMSDLVSYNLDSSSNTYTVKARDNFNASDIKISNTYQGKKVVGIANDGFRNCKTLKYISIPENVYKIGNNAFDNCNSLETIEGIDCILFLGSYAFQNCSSLKNITISSKINTLSAYLFNGCTNLEEVNWDIGYLFDEEKKGFPVIKNKDVSIVVNRNCFAGCSSLRNISFDKYLTRIDSNAFFGCSSLRYLILQNNLMIGVGAFDSTSVDVFVLGDKFSYSSAWLQEWTGNPRFYKELYDDESSVFNEKKYWYYVDGMPFAY